MKPILKRLLTSIVLVNTYLIIHGQAFNATYTYDPNGNRITANVIYLTSATSLKSAVISLDTLIKLNSINAADTTGLPKDGWNKGITNPSDNFTATVYPNPVHGLLIIELKNNENLSTGNNNIRVWNMQGSQVINIANLSSTNNVDFTKLPYGSYILKITVNGSTKDYKIIKN